MGGKMFAELMTIYLQGLVFSTITVLSICGFWIFFRAKRKLDKTALQRQQFLYEMIMIALLLIPVLSFAFMSILIVLKS